MLTEFNGEVALSNTSMCPLPSPDFSPSVTTTTLDNLDAILDAENAENDAQTRLDNMRAEVERRAENLGPGLAHFLSTAFHTSSAASKKSSLLGTMQVWWKWLTDSLITEPETSTLTDSEMSELKSAFQSDSASDKNLWPENSGYKKVEVGHVDSEVSQIAYNEQTAQNLFQSCLENPTLDNRFQVSFFTDTFKDQIPSEFIVNFLVALMRKGFSNNLEVIQDVPSFLLASDIAARFYDKMTDVQRLALVHYAITAGNRDFFECLAHAQSLANEKLPPHAIESSESQILNDLIAKMKQNPDNFELFSQNLAWENTLQNMINPFSVTFKEEKFKQFITPCYEHIKGDDKRSFELCMNTARLEGFERKTVKP